ncbi:MAG TPA: hypothetical protein VN861_06490 [Candidatus Acidoferrales bacterium]|nr:hypothetical protein [Candidatus Acidoferrales bacterium]
MDLKPKTHFEQVPVELVKKIAKLDKPLDETGRTDLIGDVIIRTPSSTSVEGAKLRDASFDIFHLELGGSVLWQGLASTMEEATEQVRQLQMHLPGRYMIASLKNGERVVIDPEPLGAQPTENRGSGNYQEA